VFNITAPTADWPSTFTKTRQTLATISAGRRYVLDWLIEGTSQVPTPNELGTFYGATVKFTCTAPALPDSDCVLDARTPTLRPMWSPAPDAKPQEPQPDRPTLGTGHVRGVGGNGLNQRIRGHGEQELDQRLMIGL
jgi:hypothetical protein